MTASNQVRVVLESVSTKLTGTYLCEVATKLGNSFKSTLFISIFNMPAFFRTKVLGFYFCGF